MIYESVQIENDQYMVIRGFDAIGLVTQKGTNFYTIKFIYTKQTSSNRACGSKNSVFLTYIGAYIEHEQMEGLLTYTTGIFDTLDAACKSLVYEHGMWDKLSHLEYGRTFGEN